MSNITNTNGAARLAAVAFRSPPGRPEPVGNELELMREGMADLVDLLSYARPHASAGELTFLREWLMPRLRSLGAEYALDDFGNIWVDVPTPSLAYGPSILWSCHVDTVHAPNATRQGIKWADDGRTLELVKRKPGRCLGADDGAGVWLLLRMIAAQVPGSYVFHRGEEVGRLGSLWVVENTPDKLKGYDACVAFDRRDYDNLITHQMGERCASEAFSDSLGAALNSTGAGLSYRSDDTGSYTDSYSYAGLVSECVNLSVGYDGEHGPRETLDALHLWRLAQAVTCADFGAVICERDCTIIDYGDDWRGGGYGYAGGYGSSWASRGREGGGGSMADRMDAAAWGDDVSAFDVPMDDNGDGPLLEFIRRFPLAVADCLRDYGLGCDELADHLTPLEIGQAQSAGLIGPSAELRSAGGGWDWDRD